MAPPITVATLPASGDRIHRKVSRGVLTSWLFPGILLICGTLPSCVVAGEVSLSAGIDSLREGFASPPASARVWVFWDWLTGNVSRRQITADLEAMHRQGISGAMIFQVSVDPVAGGPRVPDGSRFMTDEWRGLFVHAVREAARLGIQVGLMASSGWNCGGPWIPAEHAGRRLVWSETKIMGPRRFADALPPPFPKVEGGRHIPFRQDTATDIAVLAIPADAGCAPIHEWQLKAGYREVEGTTPDLLGWATKADAQDKGIPVSSVVDLTDRLDDEGRLEWDAPEGDWVVLRIAHAVGGRERQFTGPGAGGFMLDHLSAAAMDLHFEATIAKLAADCGELVGKAFTFVECDSCDLGTVNWTPQFAEEFARRRGYAIVRYLPALTGRVVGTREITERFLYDFRKTIADCIADNHYGRFRELCRGRGLSFVSEAGGPPPVMVDALQCYHRTDVPMGEFWTENHTMHVRGAASAAHTCGCRVVAAEAFTSWQHWTQGPPEMKPFADRAFCEGMNRCVIHGFACSPPEAGVPGNVFYAGTHFGPNVTWWNQARGLCDYLARCQFMLQQGLPVADVCCFPGAAVPGFIPPKRDYWYELSPSLGEDYACDFAAEDVILDRMQVRDGRLELPDGMSYRLLVLPDAIAAGHPCHGRFLTPELGRRLAELLEAGATVVWPRPTLAPGLQGHPECDEQIASLASELWGAEETDAGERRIGRGKLVWGRTPRQALLEAGVAPDFEQRPAAPAQQRLSYIHRRLGDTDIYFVANRDPARWADTACLFRVSGRRPELWDPGSGRIVRQTVFDEIDGRTWLPLRLPPAGSVFVVFRQAADGSGIVAVERDGKTLVSSRSDAPPAISDFEVEAEPGQPPTLLASKPGNHVVRMADGTHASARVESIPPTVAVPAPWQVRFLAGPNAPPDTVFETLASWSKHDTAQVRFFSGTAAYLARFTLGPEHVNDDVRVFLNLGAVRNLAEVRLNDKPCGLLWTQPYRLDVTDAIAAGDNALEVRVTNYWPNRLIGDAIAPQHERVTRTNMTVFKKDSSLLEAGLLGPVTLDFAKRVPFAESTDQAK
jgi:hypothetical protein